MKILVNIGCEKKDVVKACNCVDTFKEYVEQPFISNGILIYEKEDVNEETGVAENVTVTAIKRSDGSFITSISPTVKNSIDAVIEVYDEEELTSGIEMVIRSKRSNAGREFFYIDLV